MEGLSPAFSRLGFGRLGEVCYIPSERPYRPSFDDIIYKEVILAAFKEFAWLENSKPQESVLTESLRSFLFSDDPASARQKILGGMVSGKSLVENYANKIFVRKSPHDHSSRKYAMRLGKKWKFETKHDKFVFGDNGQVCACFSIACTNILLLDVGRRKKYIRYSKGEYDRFVDVSFDRRSKSFLVVSNNRRNGTSSLILVKMEEHSREILTLPLNILKARLIYEEPLLPPPLSCLLLTDNSLVLHNFSSNRQTKIIGEEPYIDPSGPGAPSVRAFGVQAQFFPSCF